MADMNSNGNEKLNQLEIQLARQEAESRVKNMVIGFVLATAVGVGLVKMATSSGSVKK